MRTLRVLLPLAAWGCAGKGDDSDEPSDGLDVGGPGETSFSTEWGAESMTLSIDNGSGAYWLGMAETGCAEAEYCWYGEDCLYGDLSETYFYCHPAGAEGVTLAYTNSLNLDEATETLLDGDLAPGVTYFVESDDSGECWIWGHDTSYYAGLGCDSI